MIPDPAAALAARRRPARILAVVNVTPDSFSDGGACLDPAAAADRAAACAAAGADALDIGGESTRPGSHPVAAAEERRRIEPAIRAIRAAGVRLPITIDTTKAEVAAAALDAGADGINDVSAGADPALLALCARRGCALVLMHCRGTPATMQDAPRYGGDEAGTVVAALAAARDRALAAGVARERIVLDPGIGFGKTAGHNLELLRALPRLDALGQALLVGLSRKRFLGALAGEPDPARRDGLSHLLHAFIAPWCDWLRVHDAAGARAALALAAERP
ncbi:MAG: hypothetical protein RLZZ127_119 [Planctomycetota bacterium]|jgi:dihydropteroate synthase